MPWIAVDISPYEFACDGPVFGIPHGWNVLTNVPFLVLGVVQLWKRTRIRRAGTPVSANWTGIWVSTIGVGLGSMAYHFFLTPFGLALDRFAISALIAYLMAYTAEVALGIGPSRRISWTLLALCTSTVVIWMLGGTAWVYGVLQAGASVAVLAIFLWADPRLRGGPGTLAVSPTPLYLFSGCYGLAKVCEVYDAEICALTGGALAGHPLKHLWAALGLLLLARMMRPQEWPNRPSMRTP